MADGYEQSANEKILQSIIDVTPYTEEARSRIEKLLLELKVIIETGGGGGSSLPDVTAEDNGKVLSVVNGEWDKNDVPSELPSVSASDNGKVLSVVEGAWAKAEASGGGVEVVFF